MGRLVENMSDKETAWKQITDVHLLKRFGTSKEVMSLALFLASEEASFMTGAMIAVDGGHSAY